MLTRNRISVVHCSSISICRLYGEEYVHMVGWLINKDHTDLMWNVQKHPENIILDDSCECVRSGCNSHAANNSTIQRGSNFHRYMLTILLKTTTAKKRNKMLKEKIKQSPYFKQICNKLSAFWKCVLYCAKILSEFRSNFWARLLN
jgi:hypothetical protein